MHSDRRRRTRNSQAGAASLRSPYVRKEVLVGAAICLFLALIVWLAFGQAIHNGFVSYDDGDYVYGNSQITNGLTVAGILWAFTHVHAANWHPLTTISHMLDCQLYGLQPWGHHLTNIVLHATAAILLFLALRSLRLLLWPSAFVAALFAIHPLRVESVAWISERKDVLSGMFFMLTLLAYVRYARGERFSFGRYLAVLILVALGLMCKPTLVTLPFVLLLLDYWPLGRWPGARHGEFVHWRTGSRELGAKSEALRTEVSGQKSAGSSQRSAASTPQLLNISTSSSSLVLEKLPLFVLSAASCVATVLAQKQALEKSLNLTLIERVGNAVVSYVAYLGQLFYPAKLAVLYPYHEHTLQTTVVVLSVLLLLVISVTSFLWRQKHPYLLSGWLWYLGMLVPMIGLLQVGLQTRADRYTYLPQIGLYIMATWGAMELFARWRFGRKILAGAALLIIIVLAACTYHETSYWQSSETLWAHAIDNTSNNDIAHYNLGSVLLRKRQPGAAIIEFQKALQINPDYGDADVDTGSALMLMGQTDQAISYFRKAIEIKPDFAAAWSNLGSALLEKGQVDEAIQCYQRALAIEPGSGDMHYNLGRAFAKKGNWAEAISCYQAARHIQPNDAKVHNSLGAALARVGKMDEALRQFGEALRINPNYPEVHYNLGCVLAYLGQRDEAATQLTEALRLKPDYPDAEKQLRELGMPPPH